MLRQKLSSLDPVDRAFDSVAAQTRHFVARHPRKIAAAVSLVLAGFGATAFGKVLRTLAQTDVRALLPQVRVPTLVMHRTGDRAVRVDAGRQLATAIPGARWLELPGTAHWWWLGETAPIIEAIRGFAGRLADGAER